MPYPSAETLSDDEFKEVLAHLNTLLRMLPAQLPFKTLSESQFAQFQNFEPDPEMLEKTGCEVAALGEELEHVFGWKARSSGDGMLPIKERGPGICSLHQAFLSRPVPDSVSAPCLSPCAPYARTPKDLRMFVSRFVKSLLYVLPI